MLDALCAQVDPDLFFPEKGGRSPSAVRVCRRCPVAAECLEFSLENRQRYGIWGGTSEKQRRRLAGDDWDDEDDEDDEDEDQAADEPTHTHQTGEVA
jgi:hypothetical protein